MDSEAEKRMAENILKPLDEQVYRNSKDSVFCNLFSKPEYLLKMYAALHPEDDITQITDITLVTLDHKLLNARYNDLGFIVGNRLVILVEHQSTWTINILIRFLMYLGETYQRYIRNNRLNVYGTKRIELPRPELYVIYTGEQGNRPEEISLAKDVFGIEEPSMSFIDVRAKIIYDGKQGDIINQYIAFSRVFDQQVKLYGKTEKAIRETLRICRDRNILKDYLAGEEVSGLMFGYFNAEEQLDFIRQEERDKGRTEGRAEGRNEGLAEGLVKGRNEGLSKGRNEGAALLGSLISKLMALGRFADVERVASDANYRERLYREFQLV